MNQSSTDASELKKQAAEQAVDFVRPGMVVGLGTGSTANYAVEAIGRKLRLGELKDIVGIPTSERTRDRARHADIALSTLDEHPIVDLTIDGADQVDADGKLLKGGGGALLWEKIVAAASRQYLIVVDESKIVKTLGDGFALPVEVVRFGWKTHESAIRELGADAVLRVKNDAPYCTDEGHYILDCHFAGGIGDPERVNAILQARPGVVETGLFLGMSPHVIVGGQGS